MCFRHISTDLKDRALWLREMGYIPDDICELLGVSRRSLSRWTQNHNIHGSVVIPPNPSRGRPRILCADAMDDLFGLLVEDPTLYLDEIQEWLIIAHNVGLSRSTLDENLRDAGISYKRVRKAAAERDEEAREEWRQYAAQNYVPSMLVFVDETSKDDRTIYRHYGRSVLNQRASITAPFVRGDRYSIVAALATDGYIAQRVVPGSLDGEEFFDFITEDVLPKMNRYPQDRSVLVMDNCAIHKSRALREIIEGSGCRLAFLPPYSPDLNPIEESFSSLKAWLRRNWHRAQDYEDPEIPLLEACAQITGDKALGWFRHSGYV